MALTFAASPTVLAQTTYVWNLSGGGTWNTTASNWRVNGVSATYVSAPTNVAVFGAAPSVNATVAIQSGGITAGQVSFDNTRTVVNYTLGTAGNTLTLNNGAADALITVGRSATGVPIYTGSGGNTITGSPIVFTNNLAITNDGTFGTTNLTIASTINRSVVGGSIIVDGQGNTAITGVIGSTVTGGLTKNGSGTLALSTATNVFTGGLIVNDGVLGVTSDAVLGNAANGIVLNAGGTLRIYGSLTLGAARTITLNGSAANPNAIDLNSSASLMIGANQFAGAGTAIVAMTGGTLTVAADNLGFTGELVVGTPRAQLVGSVLARQTYATSAGATLVLNNTGSLTNVTGLTINNGAGLTIVQPSTAVATLGRLAAAPLTFHSGHFQYNAGTNAGAGIADAFGPVTLTGSTVIGASNTAGAASGTTVTFGTLTRLDNAALMFRTFSPSAIGTIGSASSSSVRYFIGGMVPDVTTNGTTRSVVPWSANITTVGSSDT